MNNNNKNKRIAVRKKIFIGKVILVTLDMQSFPSYNGIPSKFLKKFRLLEISLMMNP